MPELPNTVPISLEATKDDRPASPMYAIVLDQSRVELEKEVHEQELWPLRTVSYVLSKKNSVVRSAYRYG